MTTSRIQTAATTPASVGVNQPVRMPPSRITGIISGREASLDALGELAEARRAAGVMPTGPKK